VRLVAYALNRSARDLIAAAVIQFRGRCVRMRRNFLRFLERAATLKKVGDPRSPEGMTSYLGRDTGF